MAKSVASKANQRQASKSAKATKSVQSVTVPSVSPTVSNRPSREARRMASGTNRRGLAEANNTVAVMRRINQAAVSQQMDEFFESVKAESRAQTLAYDWFAI